MSDRAGRRRGLRALLSVGALLGSTALLPLASAAEPERFVLSAGAGLLAPGDSDVRDVYGGIRVPLALDGDLRIGSWLWLSAGGRWASTAGHTLVESAPSGAEGRPVRLEDWSVRLGALASRYRGTRTRWTAGVAVAFGRYQERWEATPVSASGETVGAVLTVGIHRNLSGHLGAGVRAELSMLRSGEGDAWGGHPDLGGFGISVALTFRD